MDFVRRAVMVFGSDLWKRICSDSATKGDWLKHCNLLL
ncbi:unnamed protein product [Arabidopsis lyrata]|nr:unnamed protein product [Arabidopsis lyrata]